VARAAIARCVLFFLSFFRRILKCMTSTTVCVFCSSAVGSREEYRRDAERLGRSLAERGFGLVYGGATVGLMGVVADAVMARGGRCVGVIPQLLVDKEVSHEGLSELHVVDTMHTRKALMAEKADAFIVLPGGYGTFEEMFEVLTWQSLRMHSKPVVLLNTAGFYDPMIAFLDHCVVEGVLKPQARAALQVAATVDDALARLTASVLTA
jgi:uncharacterized protein (TIGR00730 family)